MKELIGVEMAIIIAKNLKRIRKETGLTQTEVAELANIHRVTYTRYETGKLNISVHHLVKVAFVLNVTVDEVLSGVIEAMQEG